LQPTGDPRRAIEAPAIVIFAGHRYALFAARPARPVLTAARNASPARAVCAAFR